MIRNEDKKGRHASTVLVVGYCPCVPLAGLVQLANVLVVAVVLLFAAVRLSAFVA